jgi:hypothetical protein
MGYMDFNGQRYFDTRMCDVIYYPYIPLKNQCLPSDSTKRIDSITLESGDVKEA